MDTFGAHNNKKPKVETVVMKNNPRNIQQLNQEEEDSSLTIVDLPVSERLLDSYRENKEKREETSLINNKKHVG